MEAGSAAARIAAGQRPAPPGSVVVEGQAAGLLAGFGQTFTRGVGMLSPRGAATPRS